MKLVAFLRRKQGLTPQEFREYYEKKHVPMALRLFPFFLDYRRNYIRHDLVHQRVDGPPPRNLEFDVITEIAFSGQDDYDRMVCQMADPAIREQVVEDENRFIDRSATITHLVDEERTKLPHGPRPETPP